MALYNKKPKIRKECLTCKCEMFVKPSLQKRKKFCCKKCLYEWLKTQSFFKGHHHSEEVKLNMSKKRKGVASWNKGLKGWNAKEKHALWKGGIASGEKRKGYLLQFTKNYRAKVNNCIGTHTNLEWEELKKRFNYMCLCCKRYEPEIKLTEDHIIPISKNGNNDIKNIQPLCKSCNSRKNARYIDYISIYQINK